MPVATGGNSLKRQLGNGHRAFGTWVMEAKLDSD